MLLFDSGMKIYISNKAILSYNIRTPKRRIFSKKKNQYCKIIELDNHTELDLMNKKRIQTFEILKIEN